IAGRRTSGRWPALRPLGSEVWQDRTCGRCAGTCGQACRRSPWRDRQVVRGLFFVHSWLYGSGLHRYITLVGVDAVVVAHLHLEAAEIVAAGQAGVEPVTGDPTHRIALVTELQVLGGI